MMREAMDWLTGYAETSLLARYGFLYRERGRYTRQA